MQKRILVAGSSGFIGGHLVRKLKKEGHYVIGVDIVEPKYEQPHNFNLVDLRNQAQCLKLFAQSADLDEVYLLSCLMGGMGYIGDTKKSYDVMIGSTQIVANVLEASVEYKLKKLFYSSSACAYNMHLQDSVSSAALKESDAFPAMPDLMYGWQKLQSELMCKAAYEQHGLDIRIARFHNVFGTEGVWDGGKEKAPAAIARKVAESKSGETITIWGDGSQRRSFLYIDECLIGVEKLMASDFIEPINIGSSEDVSIRELAKMVIAISGKKLSIEYDTTKPQGVRGRNSDNTLIEKTLNWKPVQKLYDGLIPTYEFINKQVNK